MGCTKVYDKEGNLNGFNCTIEEKPIDLNFNNILDKEEEEIIKSAPIEIISKFCNGESIAFGSDSEGICGIAKFYDSEEDFLKDYEQMFGENYNLDEVVVFDVYYNKIYENENDDGCFIMRTNKPLPENTMFIGEFYGIEY
jgi:hypothetical protein